MSEIKAVAIYPDKRVEFKEFPAKESNLEAFQEIVDGWIEPVTLTDGSTMYVNEEFRYKFTADDYNSIASDVAGLGGRPDLMLTGILGGVVIVGPVDDEGYDTSLTDAARKWVQRVKREAGGPK